LTGTSGPGCASSSEAAEEREDSGQEQRADRVDLVLKDIQDRDNTIYRVIFEADPIPPAYEKQDMVV
jgi:hypothetical protein